MVQIRIQSTKKIARALELPFVYEVEDASRITIADVKRGIQAKFPEFSVERQRLTLPLKNTSANDDRQKKQSAVAPSDESTLADVGLSNGGTLNVKDLGKQISWTTVFVIEYAGPLIIHFLLYNYYPSDVTFKRSKMQAFSFYMIMLHFLKRELETLFVHRFSKATMPFTYVFRNSAHYWTLGGLLLAVSLYGPWYSHTRLQGTLRDDPAFLWGCLGAWTVMELLNFSAHYTLRNLRPPGTRLRGIPYGLLFQTVSCPNYTAEILGWCIVWLMTGDIWCGIFTVVGGAVMTNWALGKHRKYKKEFGKNYPQQRKAIFPFVL